ncbi:hypothetical protein Unana1_03741 [Umbelopsis nana]
MSISHRANDIWQKALNAAPEKSPAIAAAVVIVVAAALYRRRQLANQIPPGYKSINDIPQPKGFPLIGNLHQLGLSQILERLENWAWEYGPVYKFSIGPTQVIVFSTAEAVEQFFKERPFNIRRPAKVEKLFEDCNIPGLFSMEGEQWRHSRNWMAPQLTQAKTSKAMPVVTKHVVTLRTAFQEKAKRMEDVQQKWFPPLPEETNTAFTNNVHYNPKDVDTDIICFREYAFSIMLDFAFAHDNNSHLPPTLFQDLKIVFEVIRRRSLWPISLYKYGIKDSMDRKYDKVIGDLRSSIKRIIEEYDPEKYKQTSDKMSTMLESLWIAAQDDEIQSSASGMSTARKAAKRITIDDVIGNLVIAIVAGYDTTSNTLNNIAYLLSTNPEAQKKLQEEADSVLGPVETRYKMTAEELEERLDEDFVKQFPYTNAIIHECNRLLPVGSLLDGQLTKDLVIDGYYMKKKTIVLAMTRVASLRSCPTPEPFKFKPERWIECTPEQRRLHDKMSWGFGGGPRICPGRHLATMELVAAIVAVFSLFDIKQIDRPFSAPRPREGSDMSAVLENVHLRFIPRW